MRIFSARPWNLPEWPPYPSAKALSLLSPDGNGGSLKRKRNLTAHHVQLKFEAETDEAEAKAVKGSTRSLCLLPFLMASQAFVALPSASQLRITWLNAGSYQPRIGITLHSCRRTFPKHSMQVMLGQFGESERQNVQLNAVTERLQEAIPDSVKHFPWKKAETVFLDRVVLLGQKASKWLLVTLFVASSLSDFLFAILRNRELLIPIGLAVGCLLTDLLKEVTTELSADSQLDKGSIQHLMAIGYFFVLLKFTSAFFGLGVRVFLLHVANGGLMQALWLWRNLSHGSSNKEKRLHEEVAIQQSVQSS